MKKGIARIALLGMITSHAVATTATFDSQNTGATHYYRPSTAGAYDWTDAGMTQNMQVLDDGWGGTSWAGITYSDVNDPTTGEWGNQFAVYGDGLDRSNTGVYGVGYIDSFNVINPTISFASAMTVNGFYANNTTFAALDMLNGSGFSKQFTTEDWFKLTIEGFDAGSTSQGTVDFFLADFTGFTEGVDNRADYMVTDWSFVDLTSLGANVSSIQFALSSSDSGAFGMNTPSYFAIDEMQAVPEPASALLIAFGAIGIVGIRRYKASIGA